ncbi:MAG: 3-dehydroquinate synthase [Gammaproteobacteria bacterium]|nr:3-dehydroquinate synthase [Gammaproteobacteria bacterium]
MQSLSVDLGKRSYPIHIGSGILGDGTLLEPMLGGRQVLVVSNESVAPLYLPTLDKALAGCDRARQVETHLLPDGEQHKTFANLEGIFDRLVELRFSRDCTLLALGGGVVGDMAGFAAACYQRGVSYVQIPTTLLAQVDSSVGGKTAVNHGPAKNMIGAFHQPVGVIVDTDTLTTLPDREYRAGLAEVIKYGLIRDPAFFSWIENNVNALAGRQAEALVHAVATSCRNKAEVVAADERETGGRALLNLGHTFGHAIESALGYGSWLHGEAVATGCVLAAEVSCRLGRINRADVERMTTLFERMNLPVRLPSGLQPARLLELMRLDKKVLDGRLRLVLLDDIGHASLASDVEPELLESVLAGAAGP